MQSSALAAAALCCLFSACGGQTEYDKARKSEKLGRYPTAISQYEDFWKLNSKSDRAPEALYRIGEIYRSVIGDFEKARAQYGNVMEWYPDSPWSRLADMAIIDCPDYFPFEAGVRTMGDSQSGGANAKTVEEFSIDEKAPARLKVKREIFAGDYKVSTDQIEFEKKDRQIKEIPSDFVFLKFPAEKGAVWKSGKEGRSLRMKIESTDENLEVKAGTFTACLKLLEIDPARPNFWRVQYFAPGRGLVLVSQGSAQRETRIMELLSWKKK